MLPAFLVRVGIDWVRHNPELSNSNPYSRCEQTLKICEKLWEENIGKPNIAHLEVMVVTAYWEEFFQAEDPLPDEKDWRDGLSKRSGQYENFEGWQEWFKTNYAKVYSENNIWTSLLMTAWASTHQYQLAYGNDSWEFRPSRSYLPTSELWRLKPHLDTVTEVLRECWVEEVKRWEECGFLLETETSDQLGRVEALGFDNKRHMLTWPGRADREREELDVGGMVGELIAPVGDSWFRRLDNVIFAHEHVDITALINRVAYVFGSKRRLFELACDDGMDEATHQAQAEGWLVETMQAQP